MDDYPKTLAEARKQRYGRTSLYGASKYVGGQCVFSVFAGYDTHQCPSKNGHGPGGLYCKSHATKVGGVDDSVTEGREFIYGVDDDGKLVKAKVLKISAKKVEIEDAGDGFGYRSLQPRESVHWTPADAVKAYVKKCHQRLLDAQDEVRNRTKALLAAEKLLKKTEANDD